VKVLHVSPSAWMVGWSLRKNGPDTPTSQP
jgi:hypothetical protein